MVGCGREGCCRRAIAGSPCLGSAVYGLAFGALVDFERVHVMEEEDRPVDFACPSPRDAFDVVIRGECDMWGELLCARGEEELVTCAAEDAACVWVDLEGCNLGVVGASGADEGVYLHAYGAL